MRTWIVAALVSIGLAFVTLKVSFSPAMAVAKPPISVLVTLRLPDSLDLKLEIERAVKARGYRRAVVLAVVGSVKKATLRFAERAESTVLPTMAEVVSINGTVTAGVAHLHVGIAPSDGKVIGGHLLEGTIINSIELTFAQVP